MLFGQKGNPNITWETNTNLNIGTEFGFWNNRLSGSVDFFNRKTSDMLFAFSVPSSLGYSSYYANVGDMVNRGVEVELNADLIRTKNVLWSFNLNLTHVKNEVTYLAPEHKSTTVEGYKAISTAVISSAKGCRSTPITCVPTPASIPKRALRSGTRT